MGRLVRDWFSGEVTEVPFEGHGRQIIARTSVPDAPQKTYHTAWSRPHRSKALRVHPDQAPRFTEAARAAGIIGASYCPQTGDLVTESRAARKFEMARRGYHDNDGGYGDAMPQGVLSQ